MKKLIFLLLLISATCQAATYYVSNDGNDLSDGLSDANAWETIAKVNGVTFSAGDNIYFNRGDTWREALIPTVSGSIGQPITFSTYGTGAKPLLLGSTNRSTTGDWDDQTGNIWTNNVDVTGAEEIDNPDFTTNIANWNLFVGSAVASMAHDVDSLRLDCTDNGASASDIQLYPDVVSIEQGKGYKLTFSAKASSSFTLREITLFKNSTPFTLYYSHRYLDKPTITTDWVTYTVYFIANITATDARVNFIMGNVVPETGTGDFRLDTVSFKEMVYLPATGDAGNIIFDNETSVGVKVETEIELDTQDYFWYDPDTNIIKVYSTANPATAHSVIEVANYVEGVDLDGNNYLTFDGLDFRYIGKSGFNTVSNASDVTGLIIRNCNYKYIGGGNLNDSGVRFGNGINLGTDDLFDILVEKNTFDQIYDAAVSAQASSPTVSDADGVSFQTNIISNAEYSFELFAALGEIANISFINNTCTDAGSGWGHSQRWDSQNGNQIQLGATPATASNIVIKNNIFDGATQYLVRVNSPWANIEALDINNNVYNDQPTNFAIWLGASYTTFAGYQTNASQDADSIQTDPLFRSATDYQLKYNSPAINAGVDVGLTRDFINTPILGLPDIGANEYVAGNSILGPKSSIFGPNRSIYGTKKSIFGPTRSILGN